MSNLITVPNLSIPQTHFQEDPSAHFQAMPEAHFQLAPRARLALVSTTGEILYIDEKITDRQRGDLEHLYTAFNRGDPNYRLDVNELVGTRNGVEEYHSDDEPPVQQLRSLIQDVLGKPIHPWKTFREGLRSHLQASPNYQRKDSRLVALTEQGLDASAVLKEGKMDAGHTAYTTQEKVRLIKRQQAMSHLLHRSENLVRALAQRATLELDDSLAKQSHLQLIAQAQGTLKQLNRFALQFEALHPVIAGPNKRVELANKSQRAEELIEELTTRTSLEKLANPSSFFEKPIDAREKQEYVASLALAGEQTRAGYLAGTRQLQAEPKAPSGEDFFIQLMGHVTEDGKGRDQVIADMQQLLMSPCFALAFGKLNAADQTALRQGLLEYSAQLYDALHSRVLDPNQTGWETQNPTPAFRSWEQIAASLEPERGLVNGVNAALDAILNPQPAAPQAAAAPAPVAGAPLQTAQPQPVAAAQEVVPPATSAAAAAD